MTLEELIASVRTAAKDQADPGFWSDEDIARWLNEAVEEAAIRGRLIHESENPDVCKIAVEKGTSVYPLHEALYELTYVALTQDGKTCPIAQTSSTVLDAERPGWRDEKDTPQYAIQSDTGIRLVPRPNADATLRLEGYRVPITPMALDEQETATPEINPRHHRHLIHWPLHRGFSIPDMETFDADRSANALGAFTQYFGLRPDSDLRRITREDTPHHVEAFWI